MDTIVTAVSIVLSYVEPVILLVGLGSAIYMAYLVWGDWDYALAWYGSVWRLVALPISTLAFFLIIGAIWHRFIQLPWYADLGVLAGIWLLSFIATLIYVYYVGKNMPDDPNKAAAIAAMVRTPLLEAVWEALEADDFEKAYTLLKVLAEEGNADAQNNLGILCECGLGTDKSDTIAEQWYRKAADQGHRNAQYELARILAADMMFKSLADSAGEEKASERLLEGCMWAYLAALKKHKDAKKAVKRIKNRMTRDQIKASKQMAVQRLSNELTYKAK